MKVASYKLRYGAFYPKSVHNYIHERVSALGRRLQRELGDEYSIKANCSKSQSEASYIRIRSHKTGVSYNVAFRNHGIFTDRRIDKVIKLSAFETWKECREVFLTKMLPTILHDMNTNIPVMKDFEAQLNEMMDIVLEKAKL